MPNKCLGTVNDKGISVVNIKGVSCTKEPLYCLECVDAIMKNRDEKIKELKKELDGMEAKK